MEPAPSRPFMPGYGILPASEGAGLLQWEWAVERLARIARVLAIHGAAGCKAPRDAGVGGLDGSGGVVQLGRHVA